MTVTISQRIRTLVLGVALAVVVLVATILIIQNQVLIRNTLSKSIARKCPYNLSESVEWTYYPKDNMTGLIAVAKDLGTDSKTLIMVFDFNHADSGMEDIIEHSDNILAGLKNGAAGKNYFVEEDVSTRSRYCYVKIRYDNRADLDDITFSKGNDISQRTLEIIFTASAKVKVKYFAAKGSGLEGYYEGQLYDVEADAWTEPAYYEIVNDML